MLTPPPEILTAVNPTVAIVGAATTAVSFCAFGITWLMKSPSNIKSSGEGYVTKELCEQREKHTESEINHIRSDIKEIKDDVKAIRDKVCV